MGRPHAGHAEGETEILYLFDLTLEFTASTMVNPK